jgi:thymidylate synthase (FAD)
MDKLFRVEVLSKTQNPQSLVYAGLHQDYSCEYIADKKLPDEKEAGRIAVKRLLSGGRGHFGCMESPSISFSIGYFPHSTMQQVRTHRIGVSVDCQSFRYTSENLVKAADNYEEVEKTFYLRPIGHYTNRQGNKYEYTQELRDGHLELCWRAACAYKYSLSVGLSEEHARGIIPFDVRQHWVMSFNARSLMHLFDLRSKKDAQLECQQLCELMWPHFESWMPEIACWYRENRWKKAKLAP